VARAARAGAAPAPGRQGSRRPSQAAPQTAAAAAAALREAVALRSKNERQRLDNLGASIRGAPAGEQSSFLAFHVNRLGGMHVTHGAAFNWGLLLRGGVALADASCSWPVPSECGHGRGDRGREHGRCHAY
jgi:hypothetical protein